MIFSNPPLNEVNWNRVCMKTPLADRSAVCVSARVAENKPRYDDNADLEIEGAGSALPIWTEFMKRASRRSEFRQQLGVPPSTIVAVRIDTETGLLAGERCEKVRSEYFVRGTEPKQICKHDLYGRSSESALTSP